MKANSSPYSIDWQKFKDLPSKRDTGLNFDALGKRLDGCRKTPYRWLRGGFRCPSDATAGQKFKIMEAAVKVFVAAMMKQGWELRSKVEIKESAYPATELSDKPQNVKLMEGYTEYVARAMFEKKDWKPLRIELPASVVGGN